MDDPAASYSGDPGFKYRTETEVSMLDLRLLFDPEDGSNASSGTSLNFYRTTQRHVPENPILPLFFSVPQVNLNKEGLDSSTNTATILLAARLENRGLIPNWG
jgi:hypothetical protein